MLAEFDIDKGSDVRLQYPEAVPGSTAEELAEYMITEGAHNFGVVSNFFSVNQNSSKELLSEQNRLLQSPQGLLLDQLFTTEKKDELLKNFWVSQEQPLNQLGNHVRAVPVSPLSAEQERL